MPTKSLMGRERVLTCIRNISAVAYKEGRLTREQLRDALACASARFLENPSAAHFVSLENEMHRYQAAVNGA